MLLEQESYYGFGIDALATERDWGAQATAGCSGYRVWARQVEVMEPRSRLMLAQDGTARW